MQQENTINTLSMANVDVNIPSVATIRITHSPEVQIALENLWLKENTFTVSCPYPASFKDTLLYALNSVKRMTFVPFANMAHHQDTANFYNDIIKSWGSVGVNAVVNTALADGFSDIYHFDLAKYGSVEPLEGDIPGVTPPFTVSISIAYESLDLMMTYSAMIVSLMQLDEDHPIRRDGLLNLTDSPTVDVVIEEKTFNQPLLNYATMRAYRSTQSLIKDIQGLHEQLVEKHPAEVTSFLTAAKSDIRKALNVVTSLMGERESKLCFYGADEPIELFTGLSLLPTEVVEGEEYNLKDDFGVRTAKKVVVGPKRVVVEWSFVK